MSTPTTAADTSTPDWAVLGRPMPRSLRIAVSLDLVVAGAIFCVLAVLTFAGAISRYFLSSPFVWLEEVQMALFLAMVFLGIGAAARTGGHVAIDVVTDLLPEKVRRTVQVAVLGVVVLVSGYYAWEALQQVLGMVQLGRATPILRIPTALIYSVVPIGFVLLVLNSVLALLFGTEVDEDDEDDSAVALQEDADV